MVESIEKTESEANIKITNITISQHNAPELFRELNGISQKARGERLRSLATIGLLCVSSPRSSLSLGIADSNNYQIKNDIELNEKSNTKELEATRKIMGNF